MKLEWLWSTFHFISEQFGNWSSRRFNERPWKFKKEERDGKKYMWQQNVEVLSKIFSFVSFTLTCIHFINFESILLQAANRVSRQVSLKSDKTSRFNLFWQLKKFWCFLLVSIKFWSNSELNNKISAKDNHESINKRRKG